MKKVFVIFMIFTSFVQAQAPSQSADLESTLHTNKWVINAQLFGVGPVHRIWSQGITAGYYINPFQLIQLEIMTGNRLMIDANGSGRESATFTAVGGHLKHLIGRSLYVKGGLDFTQVNYNYAYARSNTNDDFGFIGNATELTLAFGNQWRVFANGVVGFDWLGISLPITSNVRSDFVSSSVSNQTSSRSELEDAETYYLKRQTINLVRFYAGFTW
ncbi:MAG: hypothetical protein H7061_13965 [Bdellovibrionaceae bacterium]|nr:hypothetical protein [Bdellovibrio sp.]